jgi:hypothetical protein
MASCFRIERPGGSAAPKDSAFRARQTRGALHELACAILTAAAAAELSAAVAKDGEMGARKFMREFARDLREQLASPKTPMPKAPTPRDAILRMNDAQIVDVTAAREPLV